MKGNKTNERYLIHHLPEEVRIELRRKLDETLQSNFLVILHHAKVRAGERTVNKGLLIKFLKEGKYRIVELNIKNNNPRCLIRTHEVNNYEIVASVCLYTGSIITCWTNHVEDNHKSLDMNLYSNKNFNEKEIVFG